MSSNDGVPAVPGTTYRRLGRTGLRAAHASQDLALLTSGTILRFLKIVEPIGVFNEFRDDTVTEFLKKKLYLQESENTWPTFIQSLNASNELTKETSKNKKEQ